MALSELDISLNIRNNTNYPQPIDIMGNPANPRDTVNATTEYRWTVTTFVFTNESAIALQYRSINSPTFSTFTFDLATQSLQGVVDALNQLGIGFFNLYTELGQTYIGSYNQNFVFGQLNVYSNNPANPNPIILFDFDQTGNYNNADTSVADLSGSGNNGTPVLGAGIGTPTTLSYFQTQLVEPKGILQIPSVSTGTQYSVLLPDVAKFAGTAPYTLMAWFTNTDTTFFQDPYQGIITAEGRNPLAIGYDFIIQKVGAVYSMVHTRFDLSTGVGYYTSMDFGSSIAPAFVANAYYFAMAGFDGNTMYLSIYANGVRYDSTLANSVGLDVSPLWGAFIGLRYNNWLNGNIGYAAIYDQYVGYSAFDTVYNATKSRYGY